MKIQPTEFSFVDSPVWLDKVAGKNLAVILVTWPPLWGKGKRVWAERSKIRVTYNHWIFQLQYISTDINVCRASV